MNRRDLLLQQMGIKQWQLHRPEILKGAVSISVAHHIRLIVIAEQKLDPHDSLVKDILLSAKLTPDNCLFINFTQVQHLNIQQPLCYWLLSQNNDKIDRTLKLCKYQIDIWQSPDLAELKQNPYAKKILWQHIQALLAKQD